MTYHLLEEIRLMTHHSLEEIDLMTDRLITNHLQGNSPNDGRANNSSFSERNLTNDEKSNDTTSTESNSDSNFSTYGPIYGTTSKTVMAQAISVIGNCIGIVLAF